MIPPRCFVRNAALAIACVTGVAFEHYADGPPSRLAGQLDTNVWAIEVRLTEAEFKALEPAAPLAFGGPTPPPGKAAKVESNREKVRNLFGMQLPWVQGMLNVNTGRINKSDIPCRIRYDGDFTYMAAAQSPKRPMFIELLDGHHIDGVTSFRLHTMQFDQTMMGERIAAHVFASLGATATRTAHAELSLTVGDRQPESIGLYTILEGVDAGFLKRNNIPESSLRIQTNGLSTIQYMGNDWNAYAALFRTHRPPSEEQQARIIAFAKWIGEAGDEEFDAKIAEFIDTESLLRYVAAHSLTSNLTGMSSVGANDFVCLDADGKFRFVAAELEIALGGSIRSGTPEQLANLQLTRPYAGECKLIDRLMNRGTFKERYLTIVRQATSEFFEPNEMNRTITSIEIASATAREREAKAAEERLRKVRAASGGGAGAFRPPPGGAAAPAPMDARSFVALSFAKACRCPTSSTSRCLPGHRK